jgi:hypothetical protein
MGFLKNAAWSLAFKSCMYTIRDHSDKLVTHIEGGKPMTDSAGGYGSAVDYAIKLEQELENIREMRRRDCIPDSKVREAEAYAAKALALFREAMPGL